MFSMPPKIVVTSFMAVVCKGIISRKWRTKSTRPKAVQPCEPCNKGMERSIPMKASAAPMGWLIFSGLTVQDFFATRTLAMMFTPRAPCAEPLAIPG